MPVWVGLGFQETCDMLVSEGLILGGEEEEEPCRSVGFLISDTATYTFLISDGGG